MIFQLIFASTADVFLRKIITSKTFFDEKYLKMEDFDDLNVEAYDQEQFEANILEKVSKAVEQQEKQSRIDNRLKNLQKAEKVKKISICLKKLFIPKIKFKSNLQSIV